MTTTATPTASSGQNHSVVFLTRAKTKLLRHCSIPCSHLPRYRMLTAPTAILWGLEALLKWSLSIFAIQLMFVTFAQNRLISRVDTSLPRKIKVPIVAMEQKREQRREQMVRRPLYGIDFTLRCLTYADVGVSFQCITCPRIF